MKMSVLRRFLKRASGSRRHGGAEGTAQGAAGSDGGGGALGAGAAAAYSDEADEPDTAPDTEMMCGCCYELLLEPTTLTCGHTFCRHCLAQWVCQTGHRDCLECRQLWHGFPQINYRLRTIISKSYPEQYETRRLQVRNDIPCQVTLDKFSQLGRYLDMQQRQGDRGPPQGPLERGFERGVGVNWRNVTPFKKGVFITASLMFLLYVVVFIMRWVFGDSYQEVPVTRWSVDRVQAWVKEQGLWAEQDVAPAFLERKIDGNLLLAVNEDDLNSMVTLDDLHFRAMCLSLNALRDLGQAGPYTLHNYKHQFMGKTFFLVFGLRNYPRLTILWMYLFDHEETFLPLLHVTSPVLDNLQDLSLYSFKFPEGTVSQWVEFGWMWVFLPYLLLAKFSWNCAAVSGVQCFLVITCCLVKTAMEAAGLQLLFTGNTTTIGRAVKNHMKQMSMYPLVAIIWPFIPTFVITFCFNMVFYLMPFIDAYNLYRFLKIRLT